jgi:hypothetical protein
MFSTAAVPTAQGEAQEDGAMIEYQPGAAASVTCDPFDGRPRTVRVGGVVASVLTIERIRDETAAYPVERGPRTVFEVRTPQGRLRLCFLHRTRRWTVEDRERQVGAVAA